MKLPKHLAIIMDGNGRWAKARRHSRVFGHVRGARVAKQVIDECAHLQIPHLTLFAFSTENWFRPEDEIVFLMALLRRQLIRERGNLIAKNIRFQCIGDISSLPPIVREEVLLTVKQTAENTGMILTFALSYGGRQEITAMAQEVARQARLGLLTEDDLDDASVAGLLPSSFLPDPDLILRTSGEYRLSNFLLWQAAYSELVFETKSWPEFTISDLHRVLEKYNDRERRFGRISQQLHPG
jgi:undecaprenyl diphosphate synthase